MAGHRKFKDPVQPIRPDLKAKFEALIKAGKQTAPGYGSGKIAGFKVIKENTNQLWRWDNLEDVRS